MLKIIINSLYALKYRSLCHTRFALLPLTPDYQLLCSFFRHFSCYSLVFFIALYLLKHDFMIYLYELLILLLLEAWMCRFFSIPFCRPNTTIILPGIYNPSKNKLFSQQVSATVWFSLLRCMC